MSTGRMPPPPMALSDPGADVEAPDVLPPPAEAPPAAPPARPGSPRRSPRAQTWLSISWTLGSSLACAFVIGLSVSIATGVWEPTDLWFEGTSGAAITGVIAAICTGCCTGRLYFVFFVKPISQPIPQPSSEPIVRRKGSAFQKETSEKTHLVWDVNTNALKVQKDQEDLASALPDQAAVLEPENDMVVTRSWCGQDLFESTGLLLVDIKTAAYMENDEKCEFYSRTLGRWLLGSVQTVVDPEKPSEILYNVVVSVGAKWQKKENVGLGELRPHLKDGDLVEVLLESDNEKQSSWSPGTIVGIPDSARGADVRLDGPPGGIVKHVTRIRRRFLEGARVGLYKGPLYGWVDAVVDSTTLPGERSKIEELKEKATRVGEFLTLGRSKVASGGDVPAGGAPSRSSAMNFWSLVPVREVVGHESILVPSFLLRSETGLEV